MRRAWTTGVGVALMLVALVLGFVARGIGPQNDGELALDETLSRHRDAVLNALSELVNVGDGPVVAPLLLAVVCLVLFFALRRRGLALQFGAMVAIGWVAAALPKFIIPRVRPGAIVAPLYSETAPDSFPSGHVAFVVAVTIAVAVLLHRSGRRYGWVLALGGVLTVAVAFLRLYAGVHWAADVVASPLFTGGILLALLPAFGWFRTQSERVLERRAA